MKEEERTRAIITKNEERLRKRDGFLVDPSIPMELEVRRIIGEMTVAEFESRFIKMACHILCTQPNPMPRVKALLGLGLNFCVRKPRNDMNIEETMTRMRKDVRRMYFFADRGEDELGEYNPKIYIRSDWDAPVASKEVEGKLDDFQRRLESLDKANRKYVGSNLTAAQQYLCEEIRDRKDHRAWPSDKNLGPCWAATTQYTERGVADHLGNETAYGRISETVARSSMTKLGYNYRSFVMKYTTEEGEDMVKRDATTGEAYRTLSDAEITFLKRSAKKCGTKLSRFYMTAKVHKTPWATRPVVSTCGTLLAGLSKWADFWLQQLSSDVPTYLKDSRQLVLRLKELGPLPPGARLFTADAVGMYTNINTDHGIATIDDWLDDYSDELPDMFPVAAVKEALKMVLQNNVFEFGDSFFEQRSGCAMGTPVACIYATLYYAYHERQTLLPKYSNNLLMMKRYIDDIFGIWIPDDDNPKAWEEFKNDLPFGILEWDVVERSRKVDFLDLTISINADRRIETRTFQKAMNLYLYLPATSAHPPSVIRGMIYGLLQTYYEQNTHREHYLETTVLLYKRLLARGWESALLKRLFDDASDKVERQLPSKTKRKKDPGEKRRNRLFLHTEYHPAGVPRREVRRAYMETCGDAFQDMETANGGRLRIPETTIAYSRPKNLRDLLTSAKLIEVEGREVSTMF